MNRFVWNYLEKLSRQTDCFWTQGKWNFWVGGSPVPRQLVFRGQKVKQVKHNSFDIYGPFRNGSPDERRAHEESNLFFFFFAFIFWVAMVTGSPPNKRQQQKEAGKTWIDANGKFTRITGMSLHFFRIFWRLKFCLLSLFQTSGTWGRRGGSVLSNCEFADFLLNFKNRFLGVLIEFLGRGACTKKLIAQKLFLIKISKFGHW